MITEQMYMATKAACLGVMFMSSLVSAVPHISERNIVSPPSFTKATKWEQFAGTLYMSHANSAALLFFVLIPIDFMLVAYYYYDLNRSRLPHAYKQKPKIPIVGKELTPEDKDKQDNEEDDQSVPIQLYAVTFWIVNFFCFGYTIACATTLKQVNLDLEPSISSKTNYDQKLTLHRGLGWASLVFLIFIMLVFLFDVLLRTPKALTSKQEIILATYTDADKSDTTKADNTVDADSKLGQLPGASGNTDPFATQGQINNALDAKPWATLGVPRPNVSQTTTTTTTNTSNSSDDKKLSDLDKAIRDERDVSRANAARSWSRHLFCLTVVWSLGVSSYVYGAAYLRPVLDGQITSIIGITRAQLAFITVGSILMVMALYVGFRFRGHWKGQEEANPPLPPPPPPKTDASVQPPPPVYAPFAPAGDTTLPVTQPPAYASNNPPQYQPVDPRVWGGSANISQPSMMGQQQQQQQQSNDPARAFDNDYMVGLSDPASSFSRNAASQQSVSAPRQQSSDDVYAPPSRKSIAPTSVNKPAAVRWRTDIEKVIDVNRLAKPSKSKAREASVAPAAAARKSIANVRAQSTAPVDGDNGLDFGLPDDDASREDDDVQSDDQDGDDAPPAARSDRRQTMTGSAGRSTSVAPTSRIRKRSTSGDSSGSYDDDVDTDPTSAAPISAAPTKTAREPSRSAASVRSASMTPQPLSVGRKGAAAPPVPSVPEEDYQ